jgi:hypothetical protein
MLIALDHKGYFNTSSCGQAINQRKERHYASQESCQEGAGKEGRQINEESHEEEITILSFA